MDIIYTLLDFIINLDKHLTELINNFGGFTYVILFLIIFCETGLFMAPFLPGDSLIFVVGALSASGTMNIWLITGVLIAAAVIGDTVNYHIGKFLGPRIFKKQNVRFLNRKHLDKAHEFYRKHGGKTVIMARFIPVIRTFAPFVAGMGSMSYGRFILYNIAGGVAWVSICVASGYFFGNIPVVSENFTLVILAIIGISLLPVVITWLANRRNKS
ncbi:DedA family protein [Ruminiclostridium cellobioparum]|uniref:Putative membrane-associated protein n=1 Tax=Ruminiclostridium cellobioparum subsp. termitidis CT1112 TaxID=1195236 RepID=S0FHB0_RUMCE|nr:DedA family protein [Ruminiclostridium cellobioparum]EMS71090.1 putative membrane-associated protein [Ruminiclostridium cellobioparum subsp. termitidis CT1112]